MIYILKQRKREWIDTYEKSNGECIDTGSNIRSIQFAELIAYED